MKNESCAASKAFYVVLRGERCRLEVQIRYRASGPVRNLYQCPARLACVKPFFINMLRVHRSSISISEPNLRFPQWCH